MAELLMPIFTPKFKRQYKKLPKSIQNKFTKQLQYLVENFRHPSLRARKKAGVEHFEARIDRHYRFTFSIEGNGITLLTIGPHDEGLGKK